MCFVDFVSARAGAKSVETMFWRNTLAVIRVQVCCKFIHRLCFRIFCFGRLLESKKGKSLQDRFRDGLAAPIVLECLKQSIGPPGLLGHHQVSCSLTNKVSSALAFLAAALVLPVLPFATQLAVCIGPRDLAVSDGYKRGHEKRLQIHCFKF